MTDSIQPIFVISLPRSGSTLLQRMIASSPGVSTVSEPWFLLPLVGMYSDLEIYSEYGQKLTSMAMADLIEALPNKMDDVRDVVRQMSLDLFRRLSQPESQFFLEKTPRNTLIIDELLQLFPSAKFIFLWRNPVSIVSSMMESFSGGRWRLHSNYVDLFKGYDSMYAAWHQNKERVLSIRYEDLVTNESGVLEKLQRYLGVDLTQYSAQFSGMELRGALGDKTGIYEYDKISASSIEKWRTSICNPYRKKWVIDYIKWIGMQRIEETGYNYNELLTDIQAMKTGGRYLLSDMIRSGYGNMRRVLVLDIVKTSISLAIRGKKRVLIN